MHPHHASASLILATPLGRQGQLTRASSADGSLYLGWSGDGWPYFRKDRERVEAMLKRTGMPTLDIDLAVFFVDQSAADAAVAEMQKHLGGR